MNNWQFLWLFVTEKQKTHTKPPLFFHLRTSPFTPFSPAAFLPHVTLVRNTLGVTQKVRYSCARRDSVTQRSHSASWQRPQRVLRVGEPRDGAQILAEASERDRGPGERPQGSPGADLHLASPRIAQLWFQKARFICLHAKHLPSFPLRAQNHLQPPTAHKAKPRPDSSPEAHR